MTHRIVALTWMLALAAGVYAATAVALSPGPDSREAGLTVCVGGSTPGGACFDDVDCPGGGTCAVVETPGSEPVRGFLTIIADKDSQDWDDTSFQNLDFDCDGTAVESSTADSTLTLILEFKKDGESYLFADTFRNLGQTCDCGLTFCTPDNPPTDPYWREPAVETYIVHPGVAILWGQLPEASRVAIAAAMGQPGKVPYLAMVDEVPICTNAAACCPGDPTDPTDPVCASTIFSNHSSQSDVLASVRRFKVTIRISENP